MSKVCFTSDINHSMRNIIPLHNSKLSCYSSLLKPEQRSQETVYVIIHWRAKYIQLSY